MKKNIIVLSIPILFGALCYFVSLLFIHGDLCIQKMEFVLTSIITCAATFSGFILTSVAILIGLSASPLMRYLRANGGLSELQCRYTETLILGLVLIIFCVILGGTTDSQNCIGVRWSTIGIGIILAYVFSMITTSYYLLKTISLSPTTSTIHTTDLPGEPVGQVRFN